MSKIVFREVVIIAGNSYAVDVYDLKAGPPGAISPGDTLITERTLPGDLELVIVQKGGHPPPPPPPTPGITVENQSVHTLKDTILRITLAITDSDPTAKITSTVTNPAHGTLLHLDGVPGCVYEYAPSTGFVGTDSFSYSATDDKGNKSNGSATVSIAVLAVEPTGSKDEFGTLEIYQDHPVHKAYFALKPGTDARQFEEKAVQKGNGRWKFPNPTQGRIEFLPYDNAKPSDAPSYNLKTVLEQQNGILRKDPDQGTADGDWPTIGGLEITWYYNMLHPGSGSHNGAAHVELVPGGFRQTSETTIVSGVKSSCQAMSMHGNNYTDGRVKFEKDSEHTSGYTVHDPEKKAALGNVVGKDVGQKFIFYAVPNPNHDPSKSGAGTNSKYFVKLEQYHDVGAKNVWTKTIEFLDDGTWGPTRGGNSDCCSGDKAYEFVVLWMTRLAIGIRCDNMNDFEFWNVTVRSIDSSKPIHAAQAVSAIHTSRIAEEVDRS